MNIFKKIKNPELTPEDVETWRAVIMRNLSITNKTDLKQIKEACREILISTSELYNNAEIAEYLK